MGNHSLRKDMTCLNCGHVVEKRFCPNCGQENTETKESFHYLFTHTIEDIVHYDSGFWKTIKYLLFYPAKLTTEYLAGKRKKYVAPVKLYIFISFITFLILSMTHNEEEQEKDIIKIEKPKTETFNSDKEKILNSSKIENNISISDTSEKNYDSIQNSLPVEKRDVGINRWLKKSLYKMTQNSKNEDFSEKLFETFMHNLPKGLFILLPIFAFVLWLFHDKSKWLYYEHGIFTIHYFSMILLSIAIFTLVTFLFDLIGKYSFIENLTYIIATSMLLWWVFYFYRSHSKFYNEGKWVSRVKSSAIFAINAILISLILAFIFIYSAVNVK